MQIYNINEVSAFKKTKEQWGEFSNMAAFPLNLKSISILTSEALYQALRYPHLPQLQKVILDQKSPMGAKMKSKPHRKDSTHSDFLYNQVQIMEWCVRLKVAQHYFKFKKLMKEATIVVENSRNDQFWGAVPSKAEENILVGENRLGKIWNKLKKELEENPNSLKTVKSLNIPSMKLLNQSINFTYQIA